MKRRRLYHEALDRCRRRMLGMALRKYGGQVALAAELLGIERAGMYKMLKDHGIDHRQYKRK